MSNFSKITFFTCLVFSCISFFCKGIEVGVCNKIFQELNPPSLNRIWIQGKPLKSDTATSSISIIELPFGKNFLTIEFISINYNNQNKLQYSHQLVGIDSNWVHLGDQRRVSYANLAPGIYPLKIKVSNDGFRWVHSTQPVNVAVTLPFWSVWWYHILLILVVLVILVVIYKVKVNAAITHVVERTEIRKRESESLRLMMAQDFHDEMGNKLASIIVLVSTLQLLIKDKSMEVQQALHRIEKASKQLFDGTKSFIWSINTQSDQISEIITYVNNFGAELYEHTSMDFSVEDTISSATKEIKLAVGYSRQLFFILKEAMTNALVHAQAKNIKIGYFIDKPTNVFSITLQDDGIGVSPEQLNSSRGLKNMKSRAAKINFDLSFFHNPEGGFSVKIGGEIPKT